MAEYFKMATGHSMENGQILAHKDFAVMTADKNISKTRENSFKCSLISLFFCNAKNNATENSRANPKSHRFVI